MKQLLLISLLFFSITSYSQTWAPPGANWKYSYTNGFGTEGYVEIKYISDTIIGGIATTKLEKSRHTYTYWNNQFDNTVFGYDFTFDDNGVVYVWFNNNWDTLFIFNASPGDSWTYAKEPNFSFCEQNSYLTVLDTGNVTINNQILKFLVVQFYSEALPFQPIDTLIEKIGFINFYMFPHDICDAEFDVNEGGGLRCYSDNYFPLYQNPSFPYNCDFIVGDEEINNNPNIFIYPNPVNSFIKVEGLPKNNLVSYSIFSIDGKLLKENVLTDEIIIDDLTGGIYFMRISIDSGYQFFKFIINE